MLLQMVGTALQNLILWEEVIMKATQKLRAIAILALGLAGSTAAWGEDVPSYVRIRSINYNGSGCPLNTVAQNIADDKKAFTLLFSEFIAEAGPGIDLSQSRKNCQITVDMDFPQGYSYSLVSFDYRGYASLDRRVEATQKTTYYFQGQTPSASFASTLRGIYDQDYHFRDTLGLEALVWSPCGAQRALNLNAQVRVNNRSNTAGRGLMTIDSIDGQVVHKYGIQWRRCQ